ncbi:M48 family metallopeptidase [Kaarinaea lacus]
MSLSTTASYFDGTTSTNRIVEISTSASGSVTITGLEQLLSFSVDQLDVQPRIGNTPRSIYLPDGAKLEVADNRFIDDLIARTKGHSVNHFVHLLESHWRYVFMAFVLTVAFVWWFTAFGIPSLAKHVAYAVPTSTDELLGQGSLETMDKFFFESSAITEDTQQRLKQLFNRMVAQANDDHSYRLEFRKSETVGANAFALPAGIVVITDELIELAESDEEIMSVLAHEIGHVVHRHGLRTVLQNSAISLIIAAVVGDITSISSIAATLPTILIHTKYSRQFETEADDYAFEFMQKNQVDTIHFANIMVRMEKSNSDGKSRTDSKDKDSTEILDYLSSHPATSERILKFKAASGAR